MVDYSGISKSFLGDKYFVDLPLLKTDYTLLRSKTCARSLLQYIDTIVMLDIIEIILSNTN